VPRNQIEVLEDHADATAHFQDLFTLALCKIQLLALPICIQNFTACRVMQAIQAAKHGRLSRT
jgi:hypothetical protein